MRDAKGLADVVVLTVKSALAPLQAQVAALIAEVEMLKGIERSYHELRDRVVVAETKALADASSYAAAIGDTKARLQAIEQRVQEDMVLSEAHCASLGRDVTAIRENVATLQAKAAQPPVAAIESPTVPSAAEAELALRDRLEPLTKQLAELSERVAVAEVRQPVPGPAGPAGKDGKDGADGLGFDDLQLVQADDRSVTVKAIRGDRVKDIGTVRFPVQIQRGVFVDGKTYELGDVVTWAGSQWHCNDTTTAKPGEALKAWTLIVKRGRDGKDGRDAVTAPVVSIGRPS